MQEALHCKLFLRVARLKEIVYSISLLERNAHPIVCQLKIINLTISMTESLIVAATMPKVFEEPYSIGIVVTMKPISFLLSVIGNPDNREICAWKIGVLGHAFVACLMFC